MLKSIILIFSGIIVGAIISISLINKPVTLNEQVDSENSSDWDDNDALSRAQGALSTSAEQGNQSPPTDCMAKIEASDETVDDTLVKKLARSRGILPGELSLLNHWFSLEDLDKYLREFDLTPTTYNRILAKAEVFYNKDYLAAIRYLYSAMRDADEVDLKVIQTELSTLVDFIQRMFFASSPDINTELFLSAMYMVNEKQPSYLPAIEALVRHHNLLGEYQDANDYIGRIPQDYENERLINSLKTQVEKSQSERNNDNKGIPLEKRGNHFIVNVTLDNKVGLKLMLDTGASRTALSKEAIRTARRLSSDFESLGVGRIVRTANGIARVTVYQGNELEVGGYRLLDPVVFSANLGTENSNSGNEVQGLLGMDFLGKFQFRIDHEKNLLFLSH